MAAVVEEEEAAAIEEGALVLKLLVFIVSFKVVVSIKVKEEKVVLRVLERK